MKAKAMVLVGLVFSAALGYALHTAPEPSSATAISTTSNPAVERLCWHIDRAETAYAVIFKSQSPGGEATDIVFRGTLEEAQTFRREMLEDPKGKYSDFRIALVTPIPGGNE
jgi:hypothetical protein